MVDQKYDRENIDEHGRRVGGDEGRDVDEYADGYAGQTIGLDVRPDAGAAKGDDGTAGQDAEYDSGDASHENDEHIVNTTRGDDGQARPDAENVYEGAGQGKVADADAGNMQDGAAWHEGLHGKEGVARPNAGADAHLQVWLGEGVRGKNVERRKSVGEIVQEIEGLSSAPQYRLMALLTGCQP